MNIVLIQQVSAGWRREPELGSVPGEYREESVLLLDKSFAALVVPRSRKAPLGTLYDEPSDDGLVNVSESRR